jgi:uncharacterized membrane protein SpoIIM required for sporulation
MKPDEMLNLRKMRWERLEGLTERAKRSIGALNEAELQELGDLYREATSDLALARRDFPAHATATYLNQLVGRAYAAVYREKPLVLARIKHFYGWTFPRLFRSLARYHWTAAALFFLPAIAMFFITSATPAAATLIFNEGQLAMFSSGEEWWRSLNRAQEAGAAALMTNNLQVAFLAFAGGMTAGVLTTYVSILNGLMLGGVFAVLRNTGTPWPLAEFVIGHGVLELSEIVFAAACGYKIAHAIMQPGLLPRSEAIATAARDALRVLMGSAPLLVIAGLIEAFVSPSETLPASVKIATGIGSGLIFYAYVLLAGRRVRGAL